MERVTLRTMREAVRTEVRYIGGTGESDLTRAIIDSLSDLRGREAPWTVRPFQVTLVADRDTYPAGFGLTSTDLGIPEDFFSLVNYPPPRYFTSGSGAGGVPVRMLREMELDNITASYQILRNGELTHSATSEIEGVAVVDVPSEDGKRYDKALRVAPMPTTGGGRIVGRCVVDLVPKGQYTGSAWEYRDPKGHLIGDDYTNPWFDHGRKLIELNAAAKLMQRLNHEAGVAMYATAATTESRRLFDEQSRRQVSGEIQGWPPL